MRPSFDEEQILWDSGFDFVIGIDEVGRGAFAGPIVAAGVVFSPKTDINILCDVNDSKLVKPLIRKRCAKLIKEYAIFWTVEQVDIAFINKHGIGKANSAAFRKVLNRIISYIESSSKYYVLIDGFHKKYLPGGTKKQKGIIKGDQKSLSIAAASILAKVHRDNLMKKVAKDFPVYKFARNKGYGTKEHQQALKYFGVSKVHRKSFDLSSYKRI